MGMSSVHTLALHMLVEVGHQQIQHVKDKSEIWGQQGFWGQPRIWGQPPHGSNRSFLETHEHAQVPVKKIGSCDSIFGLVNSPYFFKITNHNQHAFNINYFVNLIKKYFRARDPEILADYGFGAGLGIQLGLDLFNTCL